MLKISKPLRVSLCLAILILIVMAPGASAKREPVCAPPNCVFAAKPTAVTFKPSGRIRKSVKSATLTVRTTSLPKGARARLTVAGNKNSKRRLQVKSGATVTVKRLRAGTWTVSVEPVIAAGKVYYPAIRVYKAKIKAGAKAKLTFDYSTAYSKAVRYALGSSIAALSGPFSGNYNLTVKDPKRALKKGSVLAVGVGKLSPNGLLVRVQSVKWASGRSTLTAVQGELSDLGRVSFSYEKSVPASVISRRIKSRLRETVDPKALGSSFACQTRLGVGSNGPELRGSLNATGPDFKLAASVENYVEPVFRMSVSGGVTMDFDIDIRGGYGCTLDLRSAPIFIGAFPIPGTLIVVNPYIEIQVTGSADVAEKFTYHVTEQISATAGAKITPFGFYPFGDLNHSHAETPLAASGYVQTKIAAGPVVTFLANGLQTGSLGLNGYVKGTLGYPQEASPARVVAGLEATGSLSLAGFYTLTSGILLHREWELIGGGAGDPEQGLKFGGPHNFAARMAEGFDLGGGFFWNSYETAATHPLVYVACAEYYCLFTSGAFPAGAESPLIFDSQTIVRGLGTWSGPLSAGEGGVGPVQCVAPASCYGVTSSGVLKYFNGSSWAQSSSNTSGFGSQTIHNLTCAPGICAGSGLGGDVNVYMGPLGEQKLHPGISIYDMSCVDSTWCLLTGRKNIDGQPLAGYWTLDSGVLSTFHPSQNYGDDFLYEPLPGQFSCASISLCFGVMGGYLVKWDGTGWSKPAGIGNGYTLYYVDCRTDGSNFCAASNSDGYIYTNTGGEWIQGEKLTTTDNALLRLSCGGTSQCTGIEGIPPAP